MESQIPKLNQFKNSQLVIQKVTKVKAHTYYYTKQTISKITKLKRNHAIKLNDQNNLRALIESPLHYLHRHRPRTANICQEH